MSKHIKLILKAVSMTVVLAMVFSMCACSRKSSGSARIQSGEQSKREANTSASTEPVPTTTEPTETDPTEPPITVTPTPSTPNNTIKKDPTETSVDELMFISDLCIGLDPHNAILLLTAILDIEQYTEDESGGSSAAPTDHYLRYLSRDILVDGILFKSIGIHENENGVVRSLDFSMRETSLFETNESLDSDIAYEALYPVFCENYGDPDEDFDSDWVTFRKSGVTGWNYDDDCDVYAFWGKGAQSVTGNDQFVIGLQCYNPEEHTAAGVSGIISDSSGDFYIQDTFGMMYSVMGMGLDEAKARVEKFFGITLGDGEALDGSDRTTSYIYDATIYIEGYKFTNIELDVNSNQIVYHISLLNTEGEANELHEECLELKDLVMVIFGDPTIDNPLLDVSKDLEYYQYDLEGDNVFSVGCYYSGMGINSLWMGLENDSLK